MLFRLSSLLAVSGCAATLSCLVSTANAQPPYVPGWQSIHRSGAGYSPYADYDHTGLNIDEYFRWPGEAAQFITSKGYAGKHSSPDDYIRVGYEGMDWYYLNTTGISKFIYQWDPKVTYAVTQPPAGTFPAQPLFCAVTMTANTKVQFLYGGIPDPLVSIHMDSKLPHPANGPKDLFGEGELNFSTWDIVKTEGSDIERTFVMQPDWHIIALGSDATGQTARPSLLSKRDISEYIRPITLAISELAPEPSQLALYGGVMKEFGIPQYGDGYNKYIYDAPLPNNTTKIRIPIAARAQGLTGADLDRVAPHVNWKLEDPLGDPAMMQQPGRVAELTNTIRATGGLNQIGLHVFDMPVKNSGFHTFKVRLQVREGTTSAGAYQDSQFAYFQAFFQPQLRTYPGAGSNSVPNWYYYYNQEYQSPGQYSPNGISQSFYNGNILIADDAIGTIKIPVYASSLSERT